MFENPIQPIFECEPLAEGGGLKVDALEKIEERSEEMKIPIYPKCPVCQTNITPFSQETQTSETSDTDEISEARYGCRNCQKEAFFSLQRENTEPEVKSVQQASVNRIVEAHCTVPEVHAFYVHVAGYTARLCRVELACLSCGYPSREIKLRFDKYGGDSYIESYYCITGCGMQTYHRLISKATQLFLVPYFRSHLYPEQTDPLEICEQSPRTDSRLTSPRRERPSLYHRPSPVETQHTPVNTGHPSHAQPAPIPDADPTPQPHAENRQPYHKSVREQILAYFEQDGVSGAMTGELKDAIGVSKVSINNHLKELVKDGELRKVSHGYYVKV